MSKLAGSRFAEPEKLATIVRIFEENTKRKLTVSSEASIIKFGGTGDNDARVGVQMGHGTLSRSAIELVYWASADRHSSAVRSASPRSSSASTRSSRASSSKMAWAPRAPPCVLRHPASSYRVR